MKKNKFLFFASLIIFISFFMVAGTALALETKLEIRYPNLSNFGVPDINNPNVTLPQFVSYFFTLGIALAGALALISFTVGAIQLIISVDNVTANTNAKDRMKGAVLGLILTLAGFLILRTINPTLITPVLSPLQPVAGVFLANGQETIGAQQQYVNYAGIPPGYKVIKYICSGQNPAYLVRFYPKENLSGNDLHYGGVNVKRLACGSSLNIEGQSLDMILETPGVYFYIGSSCGGFVTSPVVENQDKFSDALSGYIKSIKIVNPDPQDPLNKIFFGTILHQQEGLANGGTCSLPILNPGCTSSNIGVSAANVFMINQEVGTAGDGVDFYSTSFGWDAGARAGKYATLKEKIMASGTQINAAQMCFDYTGVNQPDTYKYNCPPNNVCKSNNTGPSSCPCPNGVGQCPNPNPGQPCAGTQTTDMCNTAGKACETFKNCPGSIRIKGDYITALYSGTSQNLYCQTFTSDVENLKAQPFVASGAATVEQVYIIPVKK